MNRNNFLILLLNLFFQISCQHAQSSKSAQKHFFSQTTRRNPSFENGAWEYKSIVSTKPHGECTGFWVQNAAGLPLMMTAKHCFGGKISEACASKFKVYSPITGREFAQCKQVVAAEEVLDIALVEMDVTSTEYSFFPLSLARRTPDANTPLMMLGFPADVERKNLPTVTENCWTRNVNNDDVFQNRPQSRDHKDWAVLHNCTTWGGNSGGPMIEKGTFKAVGLPSTYNKFALPDHPIDSNTSNNADLARMDLMSGFVVEFTDILSDWGVVIE